MRLIDVTLRDGGHQVNFEWPVQYVDDHMSLMSQVGEELDFIEIGYWKQYGKFSGKFYSLNEERMLSLPSWKPGDPRRAIMSDFHYCPKNPMLYPVADNGLALLRMTARKEDVSQALELLRQIKDTTGLKVSLNLFNITNYGHEDIIRALGHVREGTLDYIYFADTHGALNLHEEMERFALYARVVEDLGSLPGLHLHDHGGFAMSNFQLLAQLGFKYSDASINGLGKGLGNLKLEQIVNAKTQIDLLSFYQRHEKLLEMPSSPYGLVGARASVTDHYSLQAEQLKVPIHVFGSFCGTLSLNDKDNFNSELLPAYIS